MAIGDSYVTGAQVAGRLGQTYDPAVHDPLAEAASRAVESFTKRQFNRSEVVEPRRFRASDRGLTRVDDFYSIDGLIVDVDGTIWTADDFDVRPPDGIVNGTPGWPYGDLLALNQCFPWRRNHVVTVSALWGWGAVPAAITLATLDVAVVMSYGASGETAGPVSGEAIDGYSVRYVAAGLGEMPDAQAPPELRKAVPYRRRWRHGFGVA